jgi:hypothetical protein
MDPAVKITRVASVVGFDPLTTLPSKNVQVTYMIGDHGPFVLITPEKEFTQEYVDAETTKRANTLRALGALPPA